MTSPRSSAVDGALAVVLLAIALLGVGAFVTLSALSATEYDTHARSDAQHAPVYGSRGAVFGDHRTAL
jgi:hypothetical protein